MLQSSPPPQATIAAASQKMLVQLGFIIATADLANGAEFTSMMRVLVGFGQVISREELAFQSHYTLNTIYRWLKGDLPKLATREGVRLILLKHLRDKTKGGF